MNLYHPNQSNKILNSIPNDIIINGSRELFDKTEIKEYVISINSGDRNKIIYPNTFDFKVKFGELKTDTNIVIPRRFQNVEYIIVENVILPLNRINTNMFVGLDIDEFSENIFYSTTSGLNRNILNLYYSSDFANFATLVPSPLYKKLPFKNKELTQLTLKFKDTSGVILTDPSDQDISISLTIGVRERDKMSDSISSDLARRQGLLAYANKRVN